MYRKPDHWKIIRVPTGKTVLDYGISEDDVRSYGFFFPPARWHQPDEDFIAEMQCRLRHDDEHTQDHAQEKRYLFILQDWYGLGTMGTSTSNTCEPPPQCVTAQAERLRAGQVWAEPEPCPPVANPETPTPSFAKEA